MKFNQITLKDIQYSLKEQDVLIKKYSIKKPSYSKLIDISPTTIFKKQIGDGFLNRFLVIILNLFLYPYLIGSYVYGKIYIYFFYINHVKKTEVKINDEIDKMLSDGIMYSNEDSIMKKWDLEEIRCKNYYELYATLPRLLNNYVRCADAISNCIPSMTIELFKLIPYKNKNLELTELAINKCSNDKIYDLFLIIPDKNKIGYLIELSIKRCSDHQICSLYKVIPDDKKTNNIAELSLEACCPDKIHQLYALFNNEHKTDKIIKSAIQKGNISKLFTQIPVQYRDKQTTILLLRNCENIEELNELAHLLPDKYKTKQVLEYISEKEKYINILKQEIDEIIEREKIRQKSAIKFIPDLKQLKKYGIPPNLKEYAHELNNLYNKIKSPQIPDLVD